MAINYQALVQKSLLSVVKSVLEDAAQNGMDFPHHFYITFKTNHDGVDIPAFLKEKYPNEMTIVLENQFRELTVTEESFSVELSFDGKYHRLTIPFKTVETFMDPSAQFALQFMPGLYQEKKPAESSKSAEVIDLSLLRRGPA